LLLGQVAARIAAFAALDNEMSAQAD
jgi:hypothetical protein